MMGIGIVVGFLGYATLAWGISGLQNGGKPTFSYAGAVFPFGK